MFAPRLLISLACIVAIAGCQCPDCPDVSEPQSELYTPPDTLYGQNRATDSELLMSALFAVDSAPLQELDSTMLVRYESDCACRFFGEIRYRLPQKHPGKADGARLPSKSYILFEHRSAGECSGIQTCRYVSVLSAYGFRDLANGKHFMPPGENVRLIDVRELNSMAAHEIPPAWQSKAVFDGTSDRKVAEQSLMLSLVFEYDEVALGIAHPISAGVPVRDTVYMGIRQCVPGVEATLCTSAE